MMGPPFFVIVVRERFDGLLFRFIRQAKSDYNCVLDYYSDRLFVFTTCSLTTIPTNFIPSFIGFHIFVNLL